MNNLVTPNPTIVKPKRNPPASGTRKTSLAWDHFTRLPFNEVTTPTAACNYYGKRYVMTHL